MPINKTETYERLNEMARFRYEGSKTTRFVIDDEQFGVKVVEYDHATDEYVYIRDHQPFGPWTKTAAKSAQFFGLPSTDLTAQYILRLWENEDIEHRYVGDGLFEATIRYGFGEAEHDYDIQVNVINRSIINIDRRVTKFATFHAVQRAKERYDLVLDADTAEAMVNLIKTDRYMPLSGAHHGTIRGQITYDTEVFTIVYSPETEQIVTVIPN